MFAVCVLHGLASPLQGLSEGGWVCRACAHMVDVSVQSKLPHDSTRWHGPAAVSSTAGVARLNAPAGSIARIVELRGCKVLQAMGDICAAVDKCCVRLRVCLHDMYRNEEAIRGIYIAGISGGLPPGKAAAQLSSKVCRCAWLPAASRQLLSLMSN